MSARHLNEREAREYKTEQRSYLWGFGLALVLTLIPFALVAFANIERLTLWTD